MGSGGGKYWWCPNCEIEVNASHVTYQELHDACGHGVQWVEADDATDKAIRRFEAMRKVLADMVLVADVARDWLSRLDQPARKLNDLWSENKTFTLADTIEAARKALAEGQAPHAAYEELVIQHEARMRDVDSLRHDLEKANRLLREAQHELGLLMDEADRQDAEP